MNSRSKTIGSLDEAIAFVQDCLRRRPDRDGNAAREAALAGRRRSHPVISIIYSDPAPAPDSETAATLPKLRMEPSPAATLAGELLGGLRSLDLENPVGAPGFGVGRGTGTLATLFGIPLNPEACNAPAFTRRIDEILAAPRPDVPRAGLMPEMKARIDLIKRLCPKGVHIGLPDIQGPYNIAHMVAGEEALVAPLLDPEQFARFMALVTDVWLEAVEQLLTWIGEAHLPPGARIPRVRECSVNLISPDTYRECVLPCDRLVAEHFPQLEIHPCSGRHVFEVTLENLPVVITEAGWMEGLAAPWIPVEDALAKIGDRPIVLRVFEYLPPEADRAWAALKGHLDRYATHPRLLFCFFSQRWRHADRPLIRDLHRRADAYWTERYGAL